MDPAGLDTSGFSDVTVGTKSMLLDCELMQLTFQFKTFIPAGSASSGLGTGHVSLEPSLLYTIKLCTDTYMQGQTAYWIALPGDPGFKGTIIHNHFSFNRALCRPCSKILVVGTLEFNEWSVLNGSVTDVATGVASSARATIVSAGPGVRVFLCDKFDVGAGTAFSLTGDHWADQLVRAEFRWRF